MKNLRVKFCGNCGQQGFAVSDKGHTCEQCRYITVIKAPKPRDIITKNPKTGRTQVLDKKGRVIGEQG